MDPGVAIAAALVAVLLIGLLIYFFAYRGDDNGTVNNPAPGSSTSQQTEAPQQSEAPSSEPSTSSSP